MPELLQRLAANRLGSVHTKTFYKTLRSAFPPDDPISAIVVRMSVLFEDLRIEHALARNEERMADLDRVNKLYRQFYFLRRSTITMVEFKGSFQQFDTLPQTAALIAQFDSHARESWMEARAFFSTHSQLLKDIRNAYGGHFQWQTANHVVQRMRAETPGGMSIEYQPAERTATPVLPYTYDLVAGAFAMHQPAGEDFETFIRRVFEIITDGWIHCTDVMHIITLYDILPRFRS